MATQQTLAARVIAVEEEYRSRSTVAIDCQASQGLHTQLNLRGLVIPLRLRLFCISGAP